MIQRVSGLERREAQQARVQQRGPAGGFGARLPQELARQGAAQGGAVSKHAISRGAARGVEGEARLSDPLAGGIVWGPG